ncbi:hypothetical protein AQ1_00175 [alpha proteobacterium Q-1]|nr:hypothetical protein AQ1_00175 [alpha proteobacterium Q-1]
MESIYYVLSWACHRKCKHCYDDRFRPYVRDALESVVVEGEQAYARIIANLPERMTYRDLDARNAQGEPEEKIGRIVLSGGDVLVDPVRTRILYPAMEAITRKYRDQGGVRIIVQTTGDLVTPEILDDLLARGMWMISISGMDDYHVGLEGDKKLPLVAHLKDLFARRGIRKSGYHAPVMGWADEEGPVYDMFGANGEEWIGALWPRGRSWLNGLSKATFSDNFCNGWSGGLHFLDHGHAGSEVSIEPNGDVYPCCLKSASPLGNLQQEALVDILDSLAGHPAFEAINMGHPERMGLSFGWDTETFYEKSMRENPKGEIQGHLCFGCDAFHREVLSKVIADLRAQRLSEKGVRSYAG